MNSLITPLKLATLSKNLFGSPEAVVLAVLGAFTNHNASEMRALLLDISIYPNLLDDRIIQALLAGGLTPPPEFVAIASQFKTSNGTKGKLVGQSFTIGSKGGYLTKIITNALGGVSGKQLTNGVSKSVLHIREYVNDVEAGSNNALTGKIIATKGSPSILNYKFGAYYPNSEFVFDGALYLKPNTKYVMHFVLGRGIGCYVKIPGKYKGGTGYDVNGINLNHQRDFPFSLYLS